MIQERSLTPQELATQEKILKGLKTNKKEFVKKYGKDAEKIMYAISIKQAKSQTEKQTKEKIREVIKKTLKGNEKI